MIRLAKEKDYTRIAEILVFNNRLNYYPIFHDETYSFGLYNVDTVKKELKENGLYTQHFYVFEDTIIKGCICIADNEIVKLYVEPVFQNQGIGAQLIEYAIEKHNVNCLWVLCKNTKAIRFYERYGFERSDETKYEEGTRERLVKMTRS